MILLRPGTLPRNADTEFEAMLLNLPTEPICGSCHWSNLRHMPRKTLVKTHIPVFSTKQVTEAHQVHSIYLAFDPTTGSMSRWPAGASLLIGLFLSN